MKGRVMEGIMWFIASSGMLRMHTKLAADRERLGLIAVPLLCREDFVAS
jgi:hypothetical protein